MVLLLLSPPISKLPPSTIAICLHASAKIFGHWAAQKAERWNDDDSSGDLLEVRRVVDKVVEGLEVFKTSADSEVQERALNILHLFSFILADLTSYTPPPPSAPPPPEDPDAFPSSRPSSPINSTPTHPKSLLLLSPLFAASYALPPVSLRAQSSIGPPEGLDLDTPLYDWEAERAEEEREGGDSKSDVEDAGRGVVREGAASGSGGRKRTEEEEELRRVVAAGVKGKGKAKKGGKKTAEEEEEKRKRKAARLARQRADPYYINDEDELDSIPVVKLELGDIMSTNSNGGPSTPKPKSKSPRPPTPPPPQIDRDGEMPEGFFSPSASSSVVPPPTSKRNSEDDEPRLADIQLDLGGRRDLARGGGGSSRRGGGGFEEYQDGDADVQPVQQQQVTAAGEGDVEVVKVVKKDRKKKKVVNTDEGKADEENGGVETTKVVKKKKKSSK